MLFSILFFWHLNIVLELVDTLGASGRSFCGPNRLACQHCAFSQCKHLPGFLMHNIPVQCRKISIFVPVRGIYFSVSCLE